MKKTTAKTLFITCFLLLVSLTSLKAQFSTIKGKIIDHTTKEPIPFCNVYLSGTSFGALTMEDGVFIIKNLIPGKYTMIISHIGYQNVVKKVQLLDGPKDIGILGLKEEPYSIATDVLVESSEDRKWKNKFKKLSRFMMGYDYEPKHIEFKNAYVAEFDNEKLPFLQPSHDFNLEIENRHLGYKTNYLVTDFSIGGRIQYVVGYPSFEELEPSNKKEKRKWTNNRTRAYEGSMTHFFKSLLENNLDENDFLASITNFDPSVNKSHYDRVRNAANYRRPLDPLKQNKDFKIEDTENDNIKRITCKHTIEVYHLGTNDQYGSSLQSYIKVEATSFLVYTNGVLLNARSVTPFGHYATKGMYDMLPFDYELTK